MTQPKKFAGWLLPAVALLLFAFLFSALPVYAAEGDGGEGDGDTTGETEASVSFTAGELRLDHVPTLDFGSHNISHEEQAYTAASAGSGVQVSDLRGNGNGWKLLVSLSPFRLEEGGGPTLKAATIRFTAPVVAAVNGTVGTPPSAGADVTLTSDSTETPLFFAGNNEGMGVWRLDWDAADITLSVKPGTAQEGRSVANLNWSLQSAP